MPPILLQTPRLLLHTSHFQMANSVLAYECQNQTHFKAWSPSKQATFYTLTHQQNRLQKQTRARENGGGIRFFIFLKTNTSSPIFEQAILGDIHFDNMVRGVFLNCTLGYKLAASIVGKGYMHEALSTAIPYIFKELGLHRIEANIMPSNSRSIQLIEKLGFEKEGYSKQFLKINNCWEDHLRYALLNKELV